MGVASSINESLDNTRVGSAASPQNIKKKGSDDIQNNFLTLLLTQMKNQDPTNPMQNNELTTQLAQISTVQGVEKLNETVGNLTGQLNENQKLTAAKLVGQGVMIEGNKISLFEKQNAQATASNEVIATPFGFELIGAADKVVLEIKDKAGNVLKTVEMAQGLKPDVYRYEWDGSDTTGNKQPAGSYRFSVSAYSQQGQVPVKPLNYALVNGVSNGPQGILLDVGLDNSISLEEIRQVL